MASRVTTSEYPAHLSTKTGISGGIQIPPSRFLTVRLQLGHKIHPALANDLALAIEGQPSDRLAGGLELKIKNRNVLIQKAEDQLFVFDLDSTKQIGAGGYGKVFRIRELISDTDYAMKTGTHVLKEAHTLDRLDADLASKGCVDRFQSKPLAKGLFKIPQGRFKQDKHQEFMISPLSHAKAPPAPPAMRASPPAYVVHDLAKLLQSPGLNRAHREHLIAELFKQYCLLRNSNSFHGDIKPGNFLIMQEGSHFKLKLADWATRTDLMHSIPKEEFCYTLSYSSDCFFDKVTAGAALDGTPNFYRICHDSFSFGQLVAKVATGEVAFKPCTFGGLTEQAFNDKAMKKASLTQSMIDLIRQLTRNNYMVPRTMQEVEEQEQAIVTLWRDVIANGIFTRGGSPATAEAAKPAEPLHE